MKADAGDILRLTRAHFLIPGIMLYILGTTFAMARGWDFDLDKFLLGYAIFGTAHLSVSFSNDYFDREGDKLGERTPISGGSGVLLRHPELARVALLMAIGLILISILLGAIFVIVFSYEWWFLVFVLLGNLVAWFYSAPPFKFAYRGLGEVSTALAAGCLMPGIGYFVMSGTIDAWFLLITLPLICYGLFFILSVELPDVESDRLAGKVNVMVKRGRDFGLALGAATTLIGTFILIAMASLDVLMEIDLWSFALLSIIPLTAGLIGLGALDGDRDRIVRQVKMNFGSLIVFLLCVDLVMLWSL
jgi:1,4-dihydroxy-2-naphthoate octaprenyltransferase